MPEAELVAISRPDKATLLEAARQMKEDFDVLPPQQMMEASMIIVGEACAQLDTDKKTSTEVIASLRECGMSEEVAAVWVRKAEEIVNSTINKDPERFVRERSGWNISAAEIVLYLAVAAGLIYFVWLR